jgi:6-phosphogluconolactonase/glucosamine-6-phosphate isomerase/deaminase
MSMVPLGVGRWLAAGIRENRHREFGRSLAPQLVLVAKNVVVKIRGEKKRQLTEQLLSYREFDPEFPLSIVLHETVTERVKIFIQNDVGVAT